MALYGKVLSPYFLDEKVLFVISTHFCHWGERFDYQLIVDKNVPISESIEKLDKEGMAAIESQDLGNFQEYLKRTKNTICGRKPIEVLLASIEQSETSEKKFETKFVRYA